MQEIDFNPALEAQHGFQPDAVVDGAALVLVRELREVRRLRDALLGLAHYAAGGESQISGERHGVLRPFEKAATAVPG